LTLDQFQLLKVIGKGTYGEVYLAKNKANGKKYALKKLEKAFILKNGKVQSVSRERDILFKMQHPNIVSLDGTFQDKDFLYFLLEYIPNGDLTSFLKNFSPLPLELAKFFAAELVSALEYMHASGIVHRDLKPENILISEDFRIKITDFGEAKTAEEINRDLLIFEEAMKNNFGKDLAEVLAIRDSAVRDS